MQVETGLLLHHFYFFFYLVAARRLCAVRVCLFVCLFVLHHPKSIVEGSSCLFPSQQWSCLIYACATVSGNHSVLFRQSRRWLHKPAPPPTHGKTRRKEATLLLVFYQQRNRSVGTFVSASRCVLSEVFSATSASSPVCARACACVCAVWCG